MQNPPSTQDIMQIPITFFNNVMLPIIGLVLIGMIVYGGVMRMLAGPNPQNVARANAIITWAIIGSIVTIASILLVKVFSNIVGINN